MREAVFVTAVGLLFFVGAWIYLFTTPGKTLSNRLGESHCWLYWAVAVIAMLMLPVGAFAFVLGVSYWLF